VKRWATDHRTRREVNPSMAKKKAAKKKKK